MPSLFRLVLPLGINLKWRQEKLGIREIMANEEAKVKLVTIDEANALLPQVRLSLKSLREQRTVILRTEAQIEIEEMTASDSKGQLSPAGQAAVTKLMETFHYQTHQFEAKLDELFQLGANLKDLDSGLVDFYSRRDGEVIFLCWKEGEDEITHWHSLQGGFKSRQPL
jgi:hypothetical protein